MGRSELSYKSGMKGPTVSLTYICRGLTDRQRAFVTEYTIDYNGERAAREVGYKRPKDMARKLTDGKHFPKVAKAIGEIQKRNLEEAILTKDEIIKELSLIAMRDPLEMCDENGVLVIDDMRKIPAHIRRAIDTVKVKTYTDAETGDTRQEFEVKLVGKATVFRMLMEHFGMFAPQRHEVTGAVGVIPWEQLFNETKEDTNVIEGKIKAVREGKSKRRTKK